jgi:hypothetical protein
MLAMGADPAPSPSSLDDKVAAANEAIAKALPSPRLYKVTASGAMSTMSGMQYCLGAEMMQQVMSGLAKAHVADAAKGCTSTHEKRADGSNSVEVVCSRAAGASTDFRMAMSGTLAHMHQHMESVVPDLISGQPKAMAMDLDFADVGDCPAGMMPGQILRADGALYDPQAELAKLTAKIEAEKAARETKSPAPAQPH